LFISKPWTNQWTFCTTEIDSWHLHILPLLDLISVDCTFCHLWYKYIYIAWTFFFTFEMFHLFVHIYYTTYDFSLVLHISSHLKLHCISTSETDICKVVHLILFRGHIGSFLYLVLNIYCNKWFWFWLVMLYILYCIWLCYILLGSDRGFPVYVLFTRLLFDLQDIF
jgi:hypothetical protein